MWHESGVGIGAHNSYGARRWTGGATTHCDEVVAEEVPVALVYNGISHAVMLSTPLDLEDFRIGVIPGREGMGVLHLRTLFR